MKRLFFILICAFLSLSVRTQTSENKHDFFGDFNFITHLAKNKLFVEAERERKILFSKEGLDPLYKDSVNFFLGLEYYYDDKLPEARELFMNVSDEVFFFTTKRAT